MNELKTLMSQQVDLLKNQIEEQNKSLKLSEKYTKQLIEQNELFDSREPSQIRVNFDAERADSKHQIEETIGRFFYRRSNLT